MEIVLKYALFTLFGVFAIASLPRITENIITCKCLQKKIEVPEKIQFNRITYVLLAMAILGLLEGAVYFTTWTKAMVICVFVFIAFIGTVIDYKMRIIPNEFVLYVFILGAISRVLDGGVQSLLGSLLSFGIVALIFGLCAFITSKISGTQGGIGAGDVKMSAAIAFAVGYPSVYLFLFGMAVTMAVYCVGGLMLHKLTLKSYFPMCGMIMAGFLVSLYVPIMGFEF